MKMSPQLRAGEQHSCLERVEFRPSSSTRFQRSPGSDVGICRKFGRACACKQSGVDQPAQVHVSAIGAQRERLQISQRVHIRTSKATLWSKRLFNYLSVYIFHLLY